MKRDSHVPTVPIKGNPSGKKRYGMANGPLFLTLFPIYCTSIVLVLGPLITMLVISFLRRSPTWGVVFNPTLVNYLDILLPVYLQTFAQSIRLALLSTLLIIVIGYPFGYFMAKLQPNWRTRVSFFLIIPFWTSSLMRLYGWIIIFRANGILDTFLLFLGVIEQPLRLLYTYPAVLIGMVYVLVPFMIYSVYSSTEKLDWNLVEAARDLGATSLQAFWTVSFKLTLPGLLSGIILTFIPSMGLFFIADILGGNKVVLVGSLIQSQLLKVRNLPFAAALSVVLMLMTTVFIALYRRITHVKDLEGLL